MNNSNLTKCSLHLFRKQFSDDNSDRAGLCHQPLHPGHHHHRHCHVLSQEEKQKESSNEAISESNVKTMTNIRISRAT